MKKLLHRIVCLAVTALLLLVLAPDAAAAELHSDQCPDLSSLIRDPQRRQFVQMMVGHYLRNDAVVRQNLEEGYSAVFFFEGCSDNMNDPELKDVSYYRVSAVCLAIRLNAAGEPYVCYFNDACSTLPDRPLAYGPRKDEVPADVGPATVSDGTYELYSVRHGGAYEALHVRTSYEDATVPAIYMTPHGYTRVQATMINVHTRTVNHILQHSMWSEGCILVGDGEFWQFSELMDSTYYAVYDYFVLDLKVGSITINRQYLQEEMYALYDNVNAVDMLLADSRRVLPEKYLEQCGKAEPLEEDITLWTAGEVSLMTLPCSNETDARSVRVGILEEDTELNLLGSITNSRGSVWYITEYEGQTCYLFSGNTKEPTWLEKFWRSITE